MVLDDTILLNELERKVSITAQHHRIILEQEGAEAGERRDGLPDV